MEFNGLGMGLDPYWVVVFCLTIDHGSRFQIDMNEGKGSVV